MTRRERLERKAARREQWAESAKQEAARRFEGARRIADAIPLGQPILVGHHSERRARRDQERIHNNMAKGCEATERAERHTQAAGGLRDALDNSIFSDDADALEQLRARIATKQARAERIKALNVAIRREAKKGTGWADRIGATDEEKREIMSNVAHGWSHRPEYPGYVLANLRNSIRADEARIRDIQARTKRAAEADAAGGVLVTIHAEYARVTFAEKPAREILDGLRAAGFWWSRGSWNGKAASLPEGLRPAPAPEPPAA